jgi:hypothetical protein
MQTERENPIEVGPALATLGLSGEEQTEAGYEDTCGSFGFHLFFRSLRWYGDVESFLFFLNLWLFHYFQNVALRIFAAMNIGAAGGIKPCWLSILQEQLGSFKFPRAVVNAFPVRVIIFINVTLHRIETRAGGFKINPIL